MGNIARITGAAIAALMLAGPFTTGTALGAPRPRPKAGKIKLGRQPHIDLRGGYQVAVPAGWEGTPAESRWFGEGASSYAKTNGIQWGAWYNWSSQGPGNLVFVGRDSDYSDPVQESSGDVLGWLENTLQAEMPRQVKLKVTSTEKGKCGALPGLVITFSEEVKQITIQDEKQRKAAEGRRMKRTLRGKAAIAVVGGKLWTVGMVTTQWVHRENAGLDALCDKVIKSFRVLSKGDMVGLNKKYGKGNVACADWQVHQTRNYRIEYNTTKKNAIRLGKHLEAIRRIYAMIWPMSGSVKPFRVKYFASRLGYIKAGAPPSSAGYFSPYQKELVTYVTDAQTTLLNDAGEPMTFELGEQGETSFHIMYHEAFHQYAKIYTGENRDNVVIPSWFNEGMGDYFFGGQMSKSGKIKIEENWWRVNTIKRHVRKGTHVPIKKILRYSKDQYYSDASRCYAEGWALCYYLLEVAPRRNKAMAEKFRSIPGVMLRQLEKNGNPQKATAKAFTGIDLDALEKDWCDWVKGLEMPDKVKAALAKAEAKANLAMVEEAVDLAKSWTEGQKYVENDPECSAIVVQATKTKKFKGSCRGAFEAEFKERTLDEMKALFKAAVKATGNDAKLVAVRIYTASGAEDEAEATALREFADSFYKFCDKADARKLSLLPSFLRGRMGKKGEGD